MVNAQGIRAGAAYIELYTKDSRLVKGLAAASAQAQGVWGQRAVAGLQDHGRRHGHADSIPLGCKTLCHGRRPAQQDVAAHRRECRSAQRTGLCRGAVGHRRGNARNDAAEDAEAVGRGGPRVQVRPASALRSRSLGFRLGPPVPRRAVPVDRGSALADRQSGPAGGPGHGSVRQIGHAALAAHGGRCPRHPATRSGGPGPGAHDASSRMRRPPRDWAMRSRPSGRRCCRWLVWWEVPWPRCSPIWRSVPRGS